MSDCPANGHFPHLLLFAEPYVCGCSSFHKLKDSGPFASPKEWLLCGQGNHDNIILLARDSFRGRDMTTPANKKIGEFCWSG